MSSVHDSATNATARAMSDNRPSGNNDDRPGSDSMLELWDDILESLVRNLAADNSLFDENRFRYDCNA